MSGLLRRARRALRAAVIGATLVLAACAAVPPAAPPDRLYSGRFAATAAQGDRRENTAGQFTLAVRGTDLQLDLATPLGSTVARVEVDARGARASGPQFEAVSGPDPEALTARLLGWRLPVGGIADWIEGRPAPGRAVRAGNADGAFEQDGWTVSVQERFEGRREPRIVLLTRAANATEPGVTLRLVLDAPGAGS